MAGPVISVVVAISAFRSDDAVLRLLEKIFSRGSPFTAVLVSTPSAAVASALPGPRTAVTVEWTRHDQRKAGADERLYVDGMHRSLAACGEVS